MNFFDVHLDRELAALGAGTLSTRRFKRAVQHARSCHRCAPRYDHAVRVLRQLEHRSPFEPSQLELDLITTMNLDSVFPATPAERPGVRWWALLATAGAGLAVLVVAGLLRTADGEWTPRGAPADVPVTLRIFCGSAEGPLAELAEGEGCAAGKALAFAAGASASLPHLALLVSGSATETATVIVPVKAAVGAEAAVPLTARLERPGEVEVLAAFGAQPGDASAAARGARVRGVVVLRRTVKVTP